MQPGWWIATDRLDQLGHPVMGPFISRDLAMEVRSLIERAERRNDLWVQEVNEDGQAVW